MFITVKEAAAAAGCSKENISYHYRRGNIPFSKTDTGHVMINRDLLPMIRNLVKGGQYKR